MNQCGPKPSDLAENLRLRALIKMVEAGIAPRLTERLIQKEVWCPPPRHRKIRTAIKQYMHGTGSRFHRPNDEEVLKSRHTSTKSPTYPSLSICTLLSSLLKSLVVGRRVRACPHASADGNGQDPGPRPAGVDGMPQPWRPYSFSGACALTCR